MKKILVALLVLACMGFVAFAEDAPAPVLTFGQYSDFETDLTSTSTFTGSVYNETYVNFKAADMGASATVVASQDYFASPRNYKVYYNFLNGMVQLNAGMLREGTARLSSYIDGNGFSTRIANVTMGLLVVAKPVDGLTAGVFVPATGTASNGDFQKVNFAVQYNIKDIANVVAGYRLENKELWVGADVKALKDITAKAGYKMVQGTSSTTSTIFLTGGMAPVENVDVGLDANVVLASTLGYGVKVLGSYAMAPLTFGAKVSYDNGADAWYKNKVSAAAATYKLDTSSSTPAVVVDTAAVAAVAATGGVVINPFVQMDFAKGDVKVGFSFDTRDSSWKLPIECELSY